MCLHQVKNMLPVLEFHEIRLTYSEHIWIVFMFKWYLEKDLNVSKF